MVKEDDFIISGFDRRTNDYGSAQWYNVVIEKPHYDFEKMKLVPDEVHSIFSPRASVLIRNGRVAAINYR